ncbi:MAG TPA: HD domain-containing protein [Spirochaetota bacterium]|nr:HD domain-containing protein [Spirochaetota bacterium]HPF05120.1 HD domain-containing protein [Spirochaetota bacterium]HPJ42906.1 HD domain-containing protein [Spirochaetota bacterium]HPR36295.1 HD domain-containing protein [Spirochaetota bacterium]HRX48124.1 HD domain-containing protein [Spirochaetota bacterium]
MEIRKTWNQDLYLKALRFAAEAHNGQKVPGTELPYIMHVVSVAMEVMAAICIEGVEDPDLAVQCALLHDTIEDTEVTGHDITLIFGAEVAAGVKALTKESGLPGEMRMKDSIYRILKMPREIAMVKLADRVTNLQPPPAHWDGKKIKHYRKEAVVILEHLGFASTHLAERLRFKLAGYGSGSTA